MSNLTVDYTGEMVPTQGLITTPIQAATQIMQGYIPMNLFDVHVPEFRDATLGYILRDTRDQDLVLNTLCAALRSAESNKSRLFVEYLSACAYSWGHTDIALKAITRNTPEETTTFTWAVAQAIAKSMPGPFYMTLLVSQMHQAETSWEQTYMTPSV